MNSRAPRSPRAAKRGVVRIAVSLPSELYELGERERLSRGVSRNEFVASLFREHLVRLERERRMAGYAAAYGSQPESEEDDWIIGDSTELLL